MSTLLEALRLHQPLPADHRWPQVPLHSGSRRGGDRPRWPAGLPGADHQTQAHAGAVDALDEVIASLRASRNEVHREDKWTAGAAQLVREAIQTLESLERKQ